MNALRSDLALFISMPVQIKAFVGEIFRVRRGRQESADAGQHSRETPGKPLWRENNAET